MGIAITLIAVLALSNCYKFIELTTDGRASIKRYVYSKFKLADTLEELKTKESITKKVYSDLLPLIYEAIQKYYTTFGVPPNKTDFIDGTSEICFVDGCSNYYCKVVDMYNNIAEVEFVNNHMRIERLKDEQNRRDYESYVNEKKNEEDINRRIESIR